MRLTITNFENFTHIKLDLNSKNISAIAGNTFEKFTDLKHLNLDENQIEQIDKETFANCGLLEGLILNNNLIQSLHSKSFECCINLVSLSLSSNCILYINEHLFENCCKLEYLYLNNNQIESIHPRSFANCVNLKELWLSHNKIKLIHPGTFDNCVSLTNLYLHGNRLDYMVFFRLNKFEYISLLSENNNSIRNHNQIQNGVLIINCKNERLKTFSLDDIAASFECIKECGAEIFHYFIQYIHKNKSSSLLDLFMSFLRENQIKSLDYLLKINSIMKIFDLNKIKNDQEQTLLHIACKQDNYDCVRLLCSYNLNTELKDKHLQTPLQIAIKESKKQAAKALIGIGCELDQAIDYSKQRNQSMTDYINELVSEKHNKNHHCIKNLVFQGGSVKGVAYIGALKILTEKGFIDIDKIQRVGGTSAGSIIAGLLGVGYTLNELEGILKNKLNFIDLLDNSDFYKNEFLKMKSELSKMNFNKFLFFLIKKATLHNTRNVLQDFLSTTIYNEIANNNGIFKGEKIRSWLDGLIEKKTGIKNAKFEDIENAIINGNSTFKRIYMTGIDIISGNTYRFSHRHSPKMPIADAIRISISIPIMFQPVKCEFSNRFGDKISGVFVDGGINDNYPVWLFDNTKYLNDIDLNVGRSIYNHETLGLRIVDTDKKNEFESLGFESKIGQNVETGKDFIKYLGKLLSALVNKQDSDHNLKKEDRKRTIYIDSCEISMLDFDLTSDKITQLINSGMKGAIDFLNRNEITEPEHPVKIRLDLLGELFKITKESRSISVNSHLSIEELIRENIDRNSSSIFDVAYKFFSKGIDEELKYFKTLDLDLANILVKTNSSGNSILHLAALDSNQECIDRTRRFLGDKFSGLANLKNNENKLYLDILLERVSLKRKE